MKILAISSFYKPAYVYGGPVKSISSMCEALVKFGAQVTVLTTDANGNQHLNIPLEKGVDFQGVQVFYYPAKLRPMPNFYYSPRLIQGIKEMIPDFDLAILEVLYTHAMGSAVRACKQAKIPYVIPLRGQLLPWSLRQKWLKKRIYLTVMGRSYLNKAAALHCTSDSESEAIDQLGIQAPKFVIPNGIDCDHFASLPIRGMIRRRFQIPDEARLLLFLGRLHPKKRPDLAIEALAAAQSLSVETHLVLAGPDEMQLIPRLQAQAQSLGCANRFHIAGLLQGDEILSVLADADLFLMPSEPESENFGMSAVEAMAAGLPILVSEGVPIGHWAELADAGRMIPSKVDSFRRVTCELLAQPNRLKEMGKRGQELVRQRFEISSVAQQMISQYKSIIETGQPLQDEAQPQLYPR